MGPLIVTGAGVSLASGIPTFRGTDPGAVWSNDVMTNGTLSYFHRNPVASWQWYLSRLTSLGEEKPQPNDAHKAIVEWERKVRARGDDFLLVTQNVDTLHEQAGSKDFIKVHGSNDRVRCSRRGCKNGAPKGTLPLHRPAYKESGYRWIPNPATDVDVWKFYEKPSFETLPRCPICHALVRPHVLWFDEAYLDHVDYEWYRLVQYAKKTASEIWFIGTSLEVLVTSELLSIGRERGLPIHMLNPVLDTMSGATHPHVGYAEVWLPEYVAGLD